MKEWAPLCVLTMFPHNVMSLLDIVKRAKEHSSTPTSVLLGMVTGANKINTIKNYQVSITILCHLKTQGLLHYFDSQNVFE